MSADEPMWLATAQTGAQVHARIGAAGRRLVAEWIGVGRLTAARDGTDHHFEPAPNADPVQIAKVKSGAVPALLRSLEGKLSAHAAAVELGGKAILFLGRAGDGKSTLTAALCSRGGRLLADDIAALDANHEWHIAPLENAHFLDDNTVTALGLVAGPELIAASAKRRVVPAEVATGPVPLAVLVQLAFGPADEAPAFQPLPPIKALAVLIPQIVRFAVDEPARHAAELDTLVNLVSRVPAFTLRRPRDTRLLMGTADIVGSLLSGGLS